MLALLTQTKVQRPWMQFGTSSSLIHFPLKSVEESLCLPDPQPKAVELRKPRSSRIPRMIRPTGREHTKDEPNHNPLPVSMADSVAGRSVTGVTDVAGVAGVAVVSPMVRSTRTSRCRIKLAHPEWTPVNRSPSPICPLGPKREISDPQRIAASGKRKCHIEPLLQLSHSVIEISDPLTNFGGRKQLLRLLCSDQKQINVPCQLINRYSTLICDRQKEPNFCFTRPIQLDSISSATVLRLVQWMQQHYHDDLKQLQKVFPSLHNARSSACTWDETFLGDNLESLLQLLLAANFLGINPLLEHTMNYFVALLKQPADVSPQQETGQTQTDSQDWNPGAKQQVAF